MSENYQIREIERVFVGANSRLLDAMAAAFGLVACSDLVLEQCETSRFMQLVKETEQLKFVPWDQVERSFRAMTQKILREGDEGREDALKVISEIHGIPGYCDAVLACARIAMVANFKIQEMEEKALADVAEALGVNPAEA